MRWSRIAHITCLPKNGALPLGRSTDPRPNGIWIWIWKHLTKSKQIKTQNKSKTKTNQKMHCIYTKHIDSTHALARIHENETETSKTPFTELTAYQKTHLTALSAMTGLLVSRLFNISSAKPHTIKRSKTHADITANHIHSALASEYLIGRRY